MRTRRASRRLAAVLACGAVGAVSARIVHADDAKAALDQPEPVDPARPARPARLPATIDQEVLVRGRIEQRLSDVPSSVALVERDAIRTSPVRTLDDLLRQVPGFTLFRRSSSLVTHPTAQGVSLRGIGPSGVSRTLVLLDGIPINDPFGGWVYWSSVPLESVDRVEVTRGGGSGVFGNYALGGVVDITTRKPREREAQIKVDAGTYRTLDLDGAVSHVAGPIGVLVDGGLFRTDGYPVVRERQRGAIDVPADSDHQTLGGRVDIAASPTTTAYVAGRFFHEARGNGTPIQRNATTSGSVATGIRMVTSGASGASGASAAGVFQVHFFRQRQTFESSFSRITTIRDAESLTTDQVVPADAGGGSAQWTGRIFGASTLTLGADGRWIDGRTEEDLFDATGKARTGRRVARGKQRFLGGFVHDVVTVASKLQVTAGLRVDLWEDLAGGKDSQTMRAGTAIRTTRVDLPLRRRSFPSPKLALLYRPLDVLAVRASAYRGFRAPTLNELYRDFRVGNLVTLANGDLGPERLTGAELGVDLAFGAGWSTRLTGYWNELEDAVSNVTVPSSFSPDCASTSACRLRSNLGRTRSRGLEPELRFHPMRRWDFAVSYLYVDSRVVDFSADKALEGKRVPQVPQHTLTLSARFIDARLLNATVQARYVGAQYEDDRNTNRLAGYSVVDAYVSKRIPLPEVVNAEVFIAVENVLGATYVVGRDPVTGVETVGGPLFVRGGARARF